MLCAPPSPDHVDLIDEALRVTREESDEQRKELIETTVVSWVASERQRFSDELSDALSARAVSVQTAALAAYERGEDVTEASETLQTLVDMTVQLKIFTKKLAAAMDGDAS